MANGSTLADLLMAAGCSTPATSISNAEAKLVAARAAKVSLLQAIEIAWKHSNEIPANVTFEEENDRSTPQNEDAKGNKAAMGYLGWSERLCNVASFRVSA